MGSPNETCEPLKQYLKQLTPQVRCRLLAELERLRLLGESTPHAGQLIAVLRAEFHNTRQSHCRVGNPSRYFFEPLEPVLVDSAPERANSGQIARGSLAPIWEVVTQKLLPSMAKEYIESTNRVVAAKKLSDARQLAAAFQSKVLTYLDGMLRTSDALATLRAGLEVYTISSAALDDLMKTMRVMHARQELAEFAHALPPNIAKLKGESLTKVLGLLNSLRAKRADALPFALTIVAQRLEKPWQLIVLATRNAGSRLPSTSPYAVVVSMVLDQIDERRLLLIDVIKHNRIPQAKDILSEIYSIEDALRGSIELNDTDWGVRLQGLRAATPL